MTPFDRAFLHVVGREGDFSHDQNDAGNWTGGEVGKGDLKGTKFGISAGQYPDLDIPLLTITDAEQIYRRDYWDAVKGDLLPPALALPVFDAAVNQGVETAIRCLQQALDVKVDGVLGPKTMAAIKRHSVRELVEHFQAERVLRYIKLPSFSTYGRGWIRRAIGTAMEAIT